MFNHVNTILSRKQSARPCNRIYPTMQYYFIYLYHSLITTTKHVFLHPFTNFLQEAVHKTLQQYISKDTTLSLSFHSLINPPPPQFFYFFFTFFHIHLYNCPYFPLLRMRSVRVWSRTAALRTCGAALAPTAPPRTRRPCATSSSCCPSPTTPRASCPTCPPPAQPRTTASPSTSAPPRRTTEPPTAATTATAPRLPSRLSNSKCLRL